MKTLGKFLFVLLLSVIHVHLSVNTQDNGLNPLTFFVLLNSYSLWLSEKNALIFGGILIQSFVTIYIAYYFLKWNNYLTWTINIIICLSIGFFIKDKLYLIMQPIEGLNSFYNRLYGSESPNICVYALLFSAIQILLLIIYPIELYLFRINRRNRGS